MTTRRLIWVNFGVRFSKFFKQSIFKHFPHLQPFSQPGLKTLTRVPLHEKGNQKPFCTIEDRYNSSNDDLCKTTALKKEDIIYVLLLKYTHTTPLFYAHYIQVILFFDS